MLRVIMLFTLLISGIKPVMADDDMTSEPDMPMRMCHGYFNMRLHNSNTGKKRNYPDEGKWIFRKTDIFSTSGRIWNGDNGSSWKRRFHQNYGSAVYH